MRTKLYASDLLKKLLTEKEITILEIVWDNKSDVPPKIERLLEVTQAV